MRIISGKYKGRIIDGFDIDGTRPTMERVKESLFAMIQGNLVGCNCLDLFSGSGNLGIEALSEGASGAVLVDSNIKAIRVIEGNVKRLSIDKDNVDIVKADYCDALKKFRDLNKKFDLIFLDPPYKTNYLEKSLMFIEKYDLLGDNGLVVCESDSLEKVIYSDYYIYKKDRVYGDKVVVILAKR